MINNKLQSKNIIDGNYVPKFINILNIFNNDKQIITNLKELTYLLENNLESKNKNNVILNYKKSIENKYFFVDEDYKDLIKWNKQFFDEEKKLKILKVIFTLLHLIKMGNIIKKWNLLNVYFHF